MLEKFAKKKIIIFLLFFIVLSSLSYTLLKYEKNLKIEQYLELKTNQQLQNYHVVYDKYKELSTTIFETRIDIPEVKEILKGLNNASDEEKVLVREKLYRQLNTTYNLLKKHNIKQLHFHLENNDSFLRFHRPQKFGDNLTNIRSTVKYVNENKKSIDGFEEGRIYNGYRFVFPLFYEDKYLGSVEVSYSTLAMNLEFRNSFDVITNFLISEDVVRKKVFDSEKSNYTKSLFKGFLVEKSLHKFLVTQGHDHDETKLFKDTHQKFKENITKGNSFSIYDRLGENIITFIMVKNPISKNIVGIFTIESDATFIFNKVRDFYMLFILSVLCIIILLLYLYKNFSEKYRLNILVNEKTKDLEKHVNLLNQYKIIVDKSLIVSKTDVNGNITYVNDAFCNVSGYKREELIGRRHNIVRHPDMSSDLFKDMWKTILDKKMWHGEVKNIKKDGSYYVTKSVIMPILDSKEIIEEFISVRYNITDIYDLKSEIELTQKEVIFTMGSICERRSKETGNHVKRVAEYSRILANKMGLNEEVCRLIADASPMHDIGKIAIDDNILHKPGPLTDEEFEVMKTHTEIGYKMLAHSQRPLLKMASIIALEHHERWDGHGYPKHLKANDITIEGRITALADTFDALSSNRVYKKEWDNEKIFDYLKEQRGKQFDPEIVDLFFKHLDEFLDVKEKFKDL